MRLMGVVFGATCHKNAHVTAGYINHKYNSTVNPLQTDIHTYKQA